MGHVETTVGSNCLLGCRWRLKTGFVADSSGCQFEGGSRNDASHRRGSELMAYVVTISASFGANGDKVGRALAERLSLPFLDRAIPASAAYAQSGPWSLVESRDEAVPSRWERLFMRFADVEAPMGPSNMSLERIKTIERFRSANEVKLCEMADTTGAV